MTTVVITGHGNYATGIKSMLDLVLGVPDHLKFVDFTEDLNSDTLYKKLEAIYDISPDGVIFLTDIAGGTPFNQSALLLHTKGKNGAVVGGINIPYIFTVLDLMEEKTDLKEIVKEAKEIAIENIKIFGEDTSKASSNNDDDGI